MEAREENAAGDTVSWPRWFYCESRGKLGTLGEERQVLGGLTAEQLLSVRQSTPGKPMGFAVSSSRCCNVDGAVWGGGGRG